MALTQDTPLVQELGQIGEYPVLAATTIYEGAAVGAEAVTGSARGLVAGDLFLGFCESQADNLLDAVGGAINVRTIQRSKVELAISGLVVDDIGADVYASADDTFTLTPGSNSFIGNVSRYISSDVGLVAYDAILKQGPELGS